MDLDLEDLREDLRQTRRILDGLLETVVEMANATKDRLERIEFEIETLKERRSAEE